MCRQMREHVDIPDTFEFLSELGANGFAVVVAGGDVPGDPSPLPVREGAVQSVLHQEVVGSSEHQIRLSKGVPGKFVLLLELADNKKPARLKAAGCLLSVELKKPPLPFHFLTLTRLAASMSSFS
jgi:hypothetical protein